MAVKRTALEGRVAGLLTNLLARWSEPSGEVVPSELRPGTVVSGIHIGPYEKLAETYTAMRDWAATQGLTLSGPMWEVYLSDPQQEPDASTWRTVIFAYVVRAPVPVSAGIR